MKYTAEMASGDIMYVLNFIQIGGTYSSSMKTGIGHLSGKQIYDNSEIK
jgi:hypothetical protein